MDIALHADMRCTDRLCGHTTVVVLNPIIEQVTNVGVQSKGMFHELHLAPLELIAESTPYRIQPRCNLDELAKQEPFITTRFMGTEGAGETGERMGGAAAM